MTLICAPRTVRLSVAFQMQARQSAPSPSAVQKANVRDDMLFVIDRQRRLVRRTLSYVWIWGWLLHHTAFRTPISYAMVSVAGWKPGYSFGRHDGRARSRT
ncbi:hypothetical protein XH88_17110 [Bradyrhizobium sp. CCBAU 51627]|nr:hypothetical protein [Bradyrhizobium sp. CCBAU 51627]